LHGEPSPVNRQTTPNKLTPEDNVALNDDLIEKISTTGVVLMEIRKPAGRIENHSDNDNDDDDPRD
jgi:hypothetical protein